MFGNNLDASLNLYLRFSALKVLFGYCATSSTHITAVNDTVTNTYHTCLWN